METQDEQERPLSPLILLGVGSGYAVLNVIFLTLARAGIIHPPWGIFGVFCFLGPLGLVISLLTIQIAGPCRFGWTSVIAFLIATGLAAFVNLLIFGEATAAV